MGFTINFIAMLNFISFPNSKNIVEGSDGKLFNSGYGEYRYLNASIISLNTDDVRTTQKKDPVTKVLLPADEQKTYVLGNISIEGDSAASRTVLVYTSMLKDAVVGANNLIKVGATPQADGTAIMSFQFSYGEGGSQNVASAKEVTDLFGFSVSTPVLDETPA